MGRLPTDPQGFCSIDMYDDFDFKVHNILKTPLYKQLSDGNGYCCYPGTDLDSSATQIGWRNVKEFRKNGTIKFGPDPTRG